MPCHRRQNLKQTINDNKNHHSGGTCLACRHAKRCRRQRGHLHNTNRQAPADGAALRRFRRMEHEVCGPVARGGAEEGGRLALLDRLRRGRKAQGHRAEPVEIQHRGGQRRAGRGLDDTAVDAHRVHGRARRQVQPGQATGRTPLPEAGTRARRARIFWPSSTRRRCISRRTSWPPTPAGAAH